MFSVYSAPTKVSETLKRENKNKKFIFNKNCMHKIIFLMRDGWSKAYQESRGKMCVNFPMDGCVCGRACISLACVYIFISYFSSVPLECISALCDQVSSCIFKSRQLEIVLEQCSSSCTSYRLC